MSAIKFRIFNDPVLSGEIEKYSRTKLLRKEDVFSNPGDEILFIPIVITGCLRIVRQNEEGKELFLYHLYPRQTCAMALTCCQAGKRNMVKAIAEIDSEILMIPVKMMEDWYVYPEWKAFVSNNYSSRFEELIQVIDLIAFSHMDEQVLHYLKERAKALNTRILDLTHQQIADELHTHREAVSRLLKTMEQKNLVRLGRNNIELLVN
jgi:CRP/FNR family transcriptional regulator